VLTFEVILVAKHCLVAAPDGQQIEQHEEAIFDWD